MRIVSFLFVALLLAGQAYGATNSGSSVVVIPGVQNGPCNTWPNCLAVPNDATHLLYSTDPVSAPIGTDNLVTLTPGVTTDAPGRSILLLVSSAGNLSVVTAKGQTVILSVPASPYNYTIPLSITAVNTTGTTATGTYQNVH